MIELAIFGSMIIMVLGMLVNYGLNADLRQRGMMQAFRGALGMTGESLGFGPQGQQTYRQSGTYLIMKDHHIPDPSHPYGVGQISPITHTANVTRGYQLHMIPDTDADLPHTRMVLQDVPFDCPSGALGCTNAGYRRETVSLANQDRYNEVYGSAAICWTATCGATRVGCDAYVTDYDPDTGIPVTICETPVMEVTIVDACEGNLMHYAGCYKQAMTIVDNAYCLNECLKSDPFGQMGKDCATICTAQTVAPPWYAAGGPPFPNLQALFANADGMGIQPDTARITEANHQMLKQETPGSITTTTSGQTVQRATRTVVWSPMAAGAPRSQTKTDLQHERTVPTENTWTVQW